jgi:RNA polymerase sigma-70 factor (ECF subfamily)
MNTNSVIVDREQLSEPRLVSAAMAGDLAAFTALCRLHSPRLFRSIRQITRNQEDAEDALQDAFMRAFVHLKSFDGRAQFATWLTRIALNSALMILRKRKYHPTVSIDSEPQEGERFLSWEIADRGDDPERRLLKSEQREWVRRAIAKLDPLPRAAVEFRNFEELSIKEGARKLNISKAAFKSRLMRGKAALRSELAFSKGTRSAAPRAARRVPQRARPQRSAKAVTDSTLDAGC